ncbi:hypothetical protein C8R46DRAFT_1027892 [Mycena filopes]|nr:hypothetical protein C8R46DRAFT_1027892 [Mycena filopes]
MQRQFLRHSAALQPAAHVELVFNVPARPRILGRDVPMLYRHFWHFAAAIVLHAAAVVLSACGTFALACGKLHLQRQSSGAFELSAALHTAHFIPLILVVDTGPDSPTVQSFDVSRSTSPTSVELNRGSSTGSIRSGQVPILSSTPRASKSRGAAPVSSQQRQHRHSAAKCPLPLRHFSSGWSVKRAADCTRIHSFSPSPALDAMLFEPLAALRRHELICSDPDVQQKIFKPGSVLLQLLAIQHSLGEAWNLNGTTFSEIQSGVIALDSPAALAALTAMYGAIDPAILPRGLPHQVTWQERFKSRHTIFESSDAMVFYRRVGPARDAAPPIRVDNEDQLVLVATDLPSTSAWLKAWNRNRERLEGGRHLLNSDDEDAKPRRKRTRKLREPRDDEAKQPRKKGKKYVPLDTPPGVRRSGRKRGEAKK